jgi:NAD(P)-dependent dehydrogenase (short-subunit alcohol dehydrogenase family)
MKREIIKNSSSDKQSLSRLAQIMPIVRGILAEPTGEQDIPFKPVILKSLTNKEAIDFACCAKNAKAGNQVGWGLPHRDIIGGLKPTLQSLLKSQKSPLFLDAPEKSATTEDIRKQLSDAISDYVNQHKCKPDIVCIRNLVILYIDTGYSILDTRKKEKSRIEHRASRIEPDLPLQNKIALVTGAAGAIGYGICRGLLENRCHLAATDLPGEKLDDFVADLEQIGGERVMGVPIDVTDKDSVVRGFESVIQTWGGIDIVVVNAGIPLISFLKDIDLEAFRKLEKVNVEGALLTLAEAARLFVLQGTGGDIIIISTKNVPSPGAGFGAYSATKAACHQLGRIASIELAQYGVRVNMVAPDGVFSEGKYKSGLWEQIGPDRMRARGLDEKGLQEYYRNRNLLKAKVTGRHVANAVLFFATRLTPTTGATIPVDGGLPDATPR